MPNEPDNYPAMTHTHYYNLYVTDGTKAFGAFTPAATRRFEFADESPSPDRPPLRHVLDWIDSQVPAIREAENAMRANPGTTTLFLEARLPIDPERADNPKHKYIGNEDRIHVGGGLEIDELKKRVTAVYEVA